MIPLLMAEPATLPKPSFAGKRILLVDDDRMNLRILRGILQGEGYVLYDADTGEKALELYEIHRPDLVLLDVMLPGINGFETCRELQKRYSNDAAPVVFITAKSESDDVVEGFSAGGIDYLPKPFRPKEALARIRTHLHNRLLVAQQRTLVDQLSRANAAKNRFLGMAAHDLRNPLASIRGLAEFLQDPSMGALSADQRDLVDTIHTASQSMLAMVNELLDVATIEAGELKLQLDPHDVAELVEKSIFLNGMEAAKKQTSILFIERTSVTLAIDGPKITQVIDNLLSNAVKYSPPGSTIRVALATTADTCTIAVRDEGPGIPEAERDRLFKDFSRLSAKPTGGEKSTGLGLAICRKIVEAHHGTVSAHNLPDRGSEFKVTLAFTP